MEKVLGQLFGHSGCSHNCAGCHNANTHSFDGGFVTDTEDLKRMKISNLRR